MLRVCNWHTLIFLFEQVMNRVCFKGGDFMEVKKENTKEKPMNGSMVNNEQELEEHSKIMEKMSTNQEIKKDDKIPDPQQ